MPQIEIYTTPLCGFCHAAKRLLKSKDAAFIETDVSGSGDKRQDMTKRANGRTTVPQIFIDGTHVGGFDDLAALERQGKLDQMLAG
ncbi:glutaredoxin 3 [Maribius pontilimi]|uniref:Glutaredoxin n=1 Tax=Palleronia pontilimi TaxID=1964209 RepID=A0A934IGR7_9RHOB|nr:glutaredoxin 3 [Palleronia pontilimi]MBJ3761579.1 glutaredoxin 3 [Palleronia pontilimi]